ncbi:MAG: hypothetical protein ACRECP_12420 [Methylocella sp.]
MANLIICKIKALLSVISLLFLFHSATATAKEEYGAAYTMSNDPAGGAVLVFIARGAC